MFSAAGNGHGQISIHAPRVGSDQVRYSHFHKQSISIHAPRVGSDESSVERYSEEKISIHAPRVGSDVNMLSIDNLAHFISIHAPRVGSDLAVIAYSVPLLYFNPRSPRGERRGPGWLRAAAGHFNPRSPRGERLLQSGQMTQAQFISIHAPRVGSDFSAPPISSISINFNPRSPRGERRSKEEGRDMVKDFNPRSPRGERPFRRGGRKVDSHFNPRSPRGERLYRGKNLGAAVTISIHAPRVGSDRRTRIA